MKKTLFHSLAILLVIVLNTGCDQLSKHAVKQHLSYHESVQLLGNNVVLTRVENEGAMLSLGSRLPGLIKFIVLQFLPLLVIVGGIIYLFINPDIPRLIAFSIASVLGGGIGNVMDRLLYGRVTDFLYIGVGDLHTGIFHLADVSISLGTLVLLLYALFGKRKQ